MIARTPEDEAEIEKSKAPLLEHLIELRKRLIWSVITFVICFVICFFLWINLSSKALLFGAIWMSTVVTTEKSAWHRVFSQQRRLVA